LSGEGILWGISCRGLFVVTVLVIMNEKMDVFASEVLRDDDSGRSSFECW
jgi:tetrahydromethanopterin S-methyltransferase subunit E